MAGAYTNAELLSKVRLAWEAEPDLARVELTPGRMGKALGRLGFRRFKTHLAPDKSERGWVL
jgi:hypothetical protein